MVNKKDYKEITGPKWPVVIGLKMLEVMYMISTVK